MFSGRYAPENAQMSSGDIKTKSIQQKGTTLKNDPEERTTTL